MSAEYTVAAVAVPLAVVALELSVLRTGLLREARYWVTMLITLVFQVLVDGFLTRRADPVVLYGDSAISGIRFPFNIPVEDFGFGFALVTLTLLVWRKTRDG